MRTPAAPRSHSPLWVVACDSRNTVPRIYPSSEASKGSPRLPTSPDNVRCVSGWAFALSKPERLQQETKTRFATNGTPTTLTCALRRDTRSGKTRTVFRPVLVEIPHNELPIPRASQDLVAKRFTQSHERQRSAKHRAFMTYLHGTTRRRCSSCQPSTHSPPRGCATLRSCDRPSP